MDLLRKVPYSPNNLPAGSYPSTILTFYKCFPLRMWSYFISDYFLADLSFVFPFGLDNTVTWFKIKKDNAGKSLPSTLVPQLPSCLPRKQPILTVCCIFFQKKFMHIQANKYYILIFFPFLRKWYIPCIVYVLYFFTDLRSCSVSLCKVFLHSFLWLHNIPLYDVSFHQSSPFGLRGFFLILIKSIVQ